MHPWLSVLVPVHNGERYIRSMLDSVVSQGADEVECIVVDDGSTDATLDIVADYRARLPLRLERRAGPGNWVRSTNVALSLATGDYACFLHQDDLWLEGRLAAWRAASRRLPQVGLFLGSAVFIDETGRILGKWHCPLPRLPRTCSTDVVMQRLLVQNFVPILAPVFRREDALRVGGMDEAAWYTADWDFWLKLAACMEVAYDPEPLVAFRIHGGSQTFQGSTARADFQSQLDTVAGRHLDRWAAPEAERQKTRRLAAFSNKVNVSLAQAAHGQRVSPMGLVRDAVLLGPLGLARYLYYSRIWERASARMRAQLGGQGA